MDVQTIKIDDVEYVRADAIQQRAQHVDGMKYCIVRTDRAGVFAGYLAGRNGNEATVKNARRLWYWDGAASLSQLAVDGVSKPKKCKFPCEVNTIDLIGVIEIIECTEKARLSIKEVAVWAQ